MPDQKPWERYGSPQPSPQGMPPGAVMIAPANPYDMPKDAAQLDNTRANTRRVDTLLPVDVKKAELDAENTRLTNEKLKYDLAHPSKPEAAADTRSATLRALQLQIARVRELYKAGPGSTKGLAGLTDYFGTPANSQFDTAGAALGEIGNAAFKVPGMGSQSDSDAARFVAANVPRASDYDTSIQEKLRAMETRLQTTYQQMGINPASGLPQAPNVPKRNDQQPMGALPGGPGGGATPSAPGGGGGVNYSTPVMGGGPTGSNMLATGSARNEVDAEATALVTGMVNAGRSPAEINAALQTMRPGIGDLNASDITALQAYRKDHPDYNGVEPITRNIAMSGYEQFRNNTAQSPLGAFAINAGNAVTGDNLDSLAGLGGAEPAKVRMGIDSVSAQNPKASFGGNLVGGALAAGALEAIAPAGIGAWGARGADAAYGAIAGAGGADDGNRLTGAIGGSLAGVGGGMFGRGATRAASGALTGVRDEAVRGLTASGVPLTFGQAVGKSGRVGAFAKGVEDRLSGLPLVGDMVNARRREGLNGFNAAAFKEGVAPIGSTAVSGVGEQGIDNARQAVSGAYDNALSGVNVAPDAQFGQDMSAALARGVAIPRTGQEFAHVVGERVAPMFKSPTVDGRQIQDMLQGIKGTNFGNDAMGSSASDALSDVGGAVTDLVGRQFPDAIPKLQGANTAYRNVNILGDAVGRGINTGGVFTPAQLGMAARANTTKFGGKLNAVSENRPFFDLQRNAQDVLPGQVPDSGTAGRLALAALLPVGTATAGAGIGAADGDAASGGGIGGGAGLGTLAILAAGGSKPAQKLLTAAVLKRPENVVRAGKALGRRAGIGGMFGAGAAPLLLPQ